MSDLPGPGDYELFPKINHPLDPRNGPDDYLNDDVEEQEEEWA